MLSVNLCCHLFTLQVYLSLVLSDLLQGLLVRSDTLNSKFLFINFIFEEPDRISLLSLHSLDVTLRSLDLLCCGLEVYLRHLNLAMSMLVFKG